MKQLAALIPNQVTGLEQDQLKYKIGTVTMKWNKVIPSGTPTLKYILTRDGFIVYEGINNYYLDEGLIPGETYNYQV